MANTGAQHTTVTLSGLRIRRPTSSLAYWTSTVLQPMQLQHACRLQPRRSGQRRSSNPWCQQQGPVRHGHTSSRGGRTTNKPPTSTIPTLCFGYWNAVMRSYAKTSPEPMVRLPPVVRRLFSKTSRHLQCARKT